jgi:uncharacterized repeat protein (TIGR01451 family)
MRSADALCAAASCVPRDRKEREAAGSSDTSRFEGISMSITGFREKRDTVVAHRGAAHAFAMRMRTMLALLAFGFASAASATLLPPTAAMTFSPSTIYIGTQNPSQLTITLTNPNPQQIGGVAFSDNYPAGFRNLSPDVIANTCGGSVQMTPNGSSLSLSGGSVQGNSFCKISVAVWGFAEGSWSNATGTITSTDTPPGNAASASLTVNRFAAPSVTKTFVPADIRPGGTAQLQVTLVNPNVSDVAGVHIGDSYPAGMTNVTNFLPIISNTCGGTLIPPFGANSFSLDSATVPANGTCTVAIAVTATASGVNTTGAVTSTNAISGAAASAPLTVTPGSFLVAPGVAPVFASSNLTIGQLTDLTITISNPNGATAISGLELHDALPAVLRIASGGDALATNTCGGTFSASPSSTFIDLVNGSIPAGSCVIKVRVVAYALGSNVANTVGPVASANAATAFPVANTINVAAAPTLNAPTLAKSFNPSTIAVGQTSQMTITLTNDNANAAPIVGLNISDVYPQGMANAPAGALVSNSCGGAVGNLGDGFTGTKSLILNGGMVPRQGSCSVVVNVVGTQIGSNIVNSVGATSSNSQLPASATAALTVTAAAPVVTKAFSPAAITLGGVSEMSITIANPNIQAITGLSFADAYPGGIANLPSGAGVLLNNTCGGNVAAAPMGTSLALSGGTIAAGGSCEVDIAVLATSSGTIHNDTGSVASADAPTSAGAGADLVVSAGALQSAPSVLKSFLLPSVTAGGTSQMTITLVNPNGQDISGAQISDFYPAGIVNSPNGIGGNDVVVNNTCGGTATASINATSASLTGAMVPANQSCSFVVNVVGTASATNQTGQVFSANAAAGGPASASLTVTPGPLLAAPVVGKSFVPSTVSEGSPSQMTIALSNPNATAIVGAQINDIYPPGIANAANAPLVSDTCSFNEDVPASGAWAKLANGTIPPGGCNVVINVVGTKAGSQVNVTGFAPSANAQSGLPASATLVVNGGALLPAPTVSQAFLPPSVLIGGTSQLKIALSNGDPTRSITGVAFTDSYPLPQNMANAAGVALVSNSCGGNVTADPGMSSVSLSGGIVPAAASCSVVVNVVGTSLGSSINHTGAVLSNNANPGADATATLTVTAGALKAAPTVTKSFTPSSILAGDASQMQIKLVNGSLTVATIGAQIDDLYPPGMINAANPVVSDTCNFVHDVPAGGTWAKLGNGTIPASGSCSIVISVIGSSTATNNTGPVLSANAKTGASAPAMLTVSPAPVSDLTLAKTHSGNFTQGQIGATYTLVATNSGAAATTGVVTVSDALPASLSATAIGGQGWVCNLQAVSCTRNDALAAGSSYSAITLTVDVPGNAPGNVVNHASVGGGAEANTANDAADDPTIIDAASLGADLTIAKSHVGNFVQGQTGAVYTLTARNIGGAATAGQVTVSDTLPPSLTATSIAGPGWTCTLAPLACARNDALAAGASYPAITLTVDVQDAAPQVVTNNAAVSGGGETNLANDSATDVTNVDPPSVPADLTLTKTHAANFGQGQTGATYALVVHNIGSGATAGAVTVSDTLPSSLVATGMSGAGWNCNVLTLICTRNDALAAGASYPPIALTVNVSPNAPANVTNVASASGGGETNTANDSASDPTTILSASGNHVPAAVGDAVETAPLGTSSDIVGDASVTDSLLDNDVDADANSLTATQLTDPARGSLSEFNADGTFTYQTNATSGTDSFTYEACDVFSCSAPATVTITIGNGLDNHIPFATDDAIEVAPGASSGALVGDLRTTDSVLDNDIDPDGDAISALKLTNPAHGDLTFNADGTFAYQNHAADNATSDAFLYEVCDNHGACDHGVVSITIDAGSSDHLPIVVDDAIQVAAGQSTTALIGDASATDSVLDNDRDADVGDTLTALKVSPLLNASGDFALNVDGTFSYQNTDLLATGDMLFYEACDAMGGCTSGIVTISINNNAPDNAPTPLDDAIVVGPNGTATTLVGGAASVLANDTDPDPGETLTLKSHLISAPTNGHITLDTDGTFVYVNDDPLPGVDAFEYEACDNEGACVAAQVQVTIDGSAPTVTCTLPPQLEVVGDAVSLDLSTLFTPPPGKTLNYSGTNLPPTLSVIGPLLMGTIQPNAVADSPYTSILTATTVPGGVSASENVIFQVLPTGEILLRNGFDIGNAGPPCP